MSKYVAVNTVVLGKRTIGIETFNLDKQEVIGFTEKQLKDSIQSGDVVLNMFINEAGDLELVSNSNMMKKIGIATFSPVKDTGGMVSDMYSLIEVKQDKSGMQYIFLNQRYGRKVLTESKLRALVELSDGANINGISIEGEKIKTWFEPVEDNQPDTKKK